MTRYFDFPKAKGKNDIHLIIYVPSTINVNKKIPLSQFRKRITETVRFLRKSLGGSTRVQALGNYDSETYGSITENICKVESFTRPVNYDKVDLKLKRWSLTKKKQWKQEYISYEYEEQLYFI
jgi:hypothetical protein